MTGIIFNNRREAFIWYATRWIGTPYHFGTQHGGDDFKGMDCSGFVSEQMQAAGLAANHDRRSAAGWFRYLLDELNRNYADRAPAVSGKPLLPTFDPGPGVLQFFRNPQTGEVYHVNICLSNLFVIGAMGGTHETVNDEAAADANAFVKIRPVDYVKPNETREIIYLDPFICLGIPETVNP